MVDAQNTTSVSQKQEKEVLAKIEPIKIEANSPDIKSSENEDIPFDGQTELEQSLISATIFLLKEYGIRKSGAAVRDAVDISHQYVGPKEAVSSLSGFGFKASFGRLNITNLAENSFHSLHLEKW